jgi:hypothetical protein
LRKATRTISMSARGEEVVVLGHADAEPR